MGSLDIAVLIHFEFYRYIHFHFDRIVAALDMKPARFFRGFFEIGFSQWFTVSVSVEIAAMTSFAPPVGLDLTRFWRMIELELRIMR